MRIKSSVTPSGVPFSVRSLSGYDQNTISKKNDNPGEQFNKMLADCIITLGEWSQDKGQIKNDKIEKLLSNDRKFILIVLRQHSLRYQPEFKFSYEFPMSGGNRDKQEHSANFTHENFPVVPYKWMRDKIQEIINQNKKIEELSSEEMQELIDNIYETHNTPETENLKESELLKLQSQPVPDGHLVDFPVLYDDYNKMLSERLKVEGTFPECGLNYQFELLNGEIEKKWAKVLADEDNIVVNQMIEMRKPVSLMPSKTGSSMIPMKFEPGSKNADMMDCEHIRRHFKDVEGTIDTSFVIKSHTDSNKKVRVDLISLVDFFFPSQAL